MIVFKYCQHHLFHLCAVQETKEETWIHDSALKYYRDINSVRGWNGVLDVIPVCNKLKDLDEEFPQAFPSESTL